MDDLTKQKGYEEFMEKVRRTVYLDNLSPQVSESVIRTALNQFGSVRSVYFIPNYTVPMNIPSCALVEMANSKQAKVVISELANFPFMMSGIPRPVRAHNAEPEMFDNRPSRPRRKIHCRWVDPKDPDFETGKKLKQLARKHAAEAALVLKQQLEEEEKLAEQQAETLKANYGKFKMLDNLLTDGCVGRVARSYNVRISDDR